MRPEDQIKTGNGVYEPSERASAGVKNSKQHWGEREGQPFYGEGMHQGNTVPRGKDYKTSTKPISGGTPPESMNQTEPGAGAQNTKVIKRGNV